MRGSHGVKTYVLDSSALISLGLIAGKGVNLFVTPSVLKELKGSLAVSIGVEQGTLKVVRPPEELTEKVMRLAREKKEAGLSTADISVLALALHLKEEGLDPIIVTDDYSIMNLAAHLNLKFERARREKIKLAIEWIIYCPSCGKTFKRWLEACPHCGSKLKRKPRRAKKLDHR